jgi:hypothetical protein
MNTNDPILHDESDDLEDTKNENHELCPHDWFMIVSYGLEPRMQCHLCGDIKAGNDTLESC